MCIRINLILLYIILSFFTPSFVYAQYSTADAPLISRDEKIIVDQEKVSEKETRNKKIDVYKTKVYQEIEAIVPEEELLSEKENITATKKRTYRKISWKEYEQVVVSAKRIPTPKRRTAEHITIYTEEDIKKLPARNLTEVLAHMPGIDAQLGGRLGQASSLSINGSAARQVLLMVDGIPFNQQLSGQANPTQIPIEHIKQIELIKGASSSAWGSSLGGVVNVITKDVGTTDKPTGTFTSSFAEFSTTKNSLDLSGKVKDVGYFLSGNFFKTEGPLEFTDTESSNGFGKVSVPLGDNAKVIASYGYNGANVKYGKTPTNTINSQPYNTRYGKVLLNIEEDNFQINTAYKYNGQEFTSDVQNATTKAFTTTTISKNAYHGLSVVGSLKMFEDDLLVMGGDFDWHRLKSNNFLNTSQEISMQAPYANYTLAWNQWDIIPGFRFDNNERFGSQLSPSLGVIYHVEDGRNSLVRGKISRAFNAPPLLWIFNNDPSQFVGPNPDLKAEKAIVYELGFETELLPSLDMELSLYRSDVKDAIVPITFRDPSILVIQTNIRKFRRQGVELLLDYDINDEWSVFGSGAFNDAENRETRETVDDQGIARQRFTFGTNYKSANGFGIYLAGYYNRWSSSPSQQPNDRKPIFDLKLIKEFKDVKKGVDLEAFLNIHNLTNSKYWSSITFPLPERYFEGGFSVKF